MGNDSFVSANVDAERDRYTAQFNNVSESLASRLLDAPRPTSIRIIDRPDGSREVHFDGDSLGVDAIADVIRQKPKQVGDGWGRVAVCGLILVLLTGVGSYVVSSFAIKVNHEPIERTLEQHPKRDL